MNNRRRGNRRGNESGRRGRSNKTITVTTTINGVKGRTTFKRNQLPWITASDESTGTHCFQVTKMPGSRLYAVTSNRNPNDPIITSDRNELAALAKTIDTVLATASE